MATQGKPSFEQLAQIRELYLGITDSVTFVEKLSQDHDWIQVDRVTEKELDEVLSMGSIKVPTSPQRTAVLIVACCGVFDIVQLLATMKSTLLRGTYMILRGIMLSAGSYSVSATLGKRGWRLYLSSGVKECVNWESFVLACCELGLIPKLMLYERSQRQIPEFEFTEDLRIKVLTLNALKDQTHSGITPAVVRNLLVRRKFKGLKLDQLRHSMISHALVLPSIVLPSTVLKNPPQGPAASPSTEWPVQPPAKPAVLLRPPTNPHPVAEPGVRPGAPVAVSPPVSSQELSSLPQLGSSLPSEGGVHAPLGSPPKKLEPPPLNCLSHEQPQAVPVVPPPLKQEVIRPPKPVVTEVSESSVQAQTTDQSRQHYPGIMNVESKILPSNNAKDPAVMPQSPFHPENSKDRNIDMPPPPLIGGVNQGGYRPPPLKPMVPELNPAGVHLQNYSHSSGKQQMNMWTCRMCRATNEASKEYCTQCKCRQPDQASWTCKVCDFMNPAAEPLCLGCNSPSSLV